jgi:hypothetical protein
VDIVVDEAGLFLGDVTLSHRHHAIFQFPFGRSLDQLIDSSLRTPLTGREKEVLSV